MAPGSTPNISKKRQPVEAIWGVSVYLVLGLAWVLVGDWQVLREGGFTSEGVVWSMGKGSLFVLLTAAFFYGVLRWHEAGMSRMEESVRDWKAVSGNIAENIDGLFWVQSLGEKTAESFGQKFQGNWPGWKFRWEGDLEGFLEGLHPEDREKTKEQMTALNPEGLTRMVYRVGREEGGWRWVLETIFPVRDREGRTQSLAGIIHDISHFKEAVDEHRRVMEEMEIIFGLSGELICKVDAEGRFTRLNGAWEKTLGWKLEEMLGRPYGDWVHPEDQARSQEQERAIHAMEERRGYVDRYKGKDGTWHWLEWNGRAADGGGVVGVARDITGRMQMLTELRLLETAAQSAAVGVVITEADSTIRWVNPFFCKMTGYEREELLGEKVSLLKSGQMPERVYADLWKTVMGGTIWRGRFINRRKDGSHFQDESTISPVMDEKGRISHFVAIKVDITDQEKLRSELERVQRMENLGMLAGGVAHDLNNVLAPITLGLGLVKRDHDPVSRTQVVEMMEKSCERGSALVRQILVLARGMGEKQVVDPGRVIRELVRFLKETFPPAIRWGVNLPETLWPIEADPTHLHQIFLNLAVNARDAMPQGGEIRIWGENLEWAERKSTAWDVLPAGQYLGIHFKDTGTGMDEATRARIFEPFFTTKEPGKGTGLGLATVLGLVRKYRGAVEVTSEPGAGITFVILLPASNKEVGPESTRAIAPPMGKGERLLVVDDEKALLEMSRGVLEAHGYRVSTAEDGAAAIASLAQDSGKIDLVLTDWAMPILDGRGLITYLRNTYPRLPIVAVTGELSAKEQGRFREFLTEQRVQVLLAKPFKAEVLLDGVARALAEGKQ